MLFVVFDTSAEWLLFAMSDSFLSAPTLYNYRFLKGFFLPENFFFPPPENLGFDLAL